MIELLDEFDTAMGWVGEHQSKIYNTMKPVFKNVDINFFGFLRVRDKKQYIGLATGEAASRAWFNQLLPIPIPPQSGFYFANQFPQLFPQAKLTSIKEHDNIDNTLFYVHHMKRWVDIYCFCSDSGNSKIINHYLNNTGLIIQSAHNFRREAHALIKTTSEKFPFIYNQEFSLHDSLTIDNQADLKFDNRRFSSYIRLKSFHNNLLNLSRRELECLEFASKFRTAKETANVLNLSARTVESYLDNARFKLNCTDKREMVRLFLEANRL